MIREHDHGGGWRALGIGLFAGRFLVRPGVLSDESFLGYRLRAAFTNGLSNPRWLECTKARFPKAYGIARWCPYCLAEDGGHWRESWYTGPAACFKHLCWLASTCGGCHHLLRWNRARFKACACGALLAHAFTDALSADVQNLIGAQPGTIMGLAVDERWNLARFLGALYSFGLGGKPLKKASRQRENVEQRFVTVGASLVADRLACFELFDRLRVSQTGERNVPLLSEAFPQLLTMLRKQLNEAERQWVLDALSDYVTHSAHSGSPVIWERKGIGKRSSCKPYDAQRARNPAVTTMLKRTDTTVPVRRTRTGRRKFVVSSAELQGVKAVQRSQVQLKTAARHAGMSVGRMWALVNAELITSSQGRIDLRSVDRLLGNIATNGAGDIAGFDDPICLTEALRLYVPVSGSAEFFRTLVEKGIELASEPGKTPALRNIFIDRRKASCIVRGLAETGSPISVVEAARLLGVKQEVMYHLVNKGLLKTRAGKLGRRTARVVDVGDLRNFTEQFLPLIAAANQAGIRARDAANWARQLGLEIVTGPLVDGGRQYWIRRPDCVGPSQGPR